MWLRVLEEVSTLVFITFHTLTSLIVKQVLLCI